MFDVSESEALHARAQAFVRASLAGKATEPFDALALALARFQAAHIPALGRLARARGVSLEEAAFADAIPAVPCDVFRLARVAVHPPELDERVFRTSGTSQGPRSRGEHAFRTTATYELSALAFAEQMLWPDRAPLSAIVLAPPLAAAPDSSLGFMLDRFAQRLGGASFHVSPAAGLDVRAVARACAAARAGGSPALVLGTSFSLAHLLEASEGQSFALPPRSRVMQTGGFKGRARELEPAELCAALARLFSVAPSHVVGEYGMTELTSQLYEGTLAAARGAQPPWRAAPLESEHGRYVAPPWMRVCAVDPVSLAPLAQGELGLARIVDLTNVDSAVAVQTSDRVRVTDAGVELFGRAAGAPPRGCSLAAEAMLEGRA